MGRLRQMGIITPLAVCQAVEDVTALTPAVKWPNDLQIGGRKFAGVLIESELAGSAAEYALIGIGINVNFDVSGEPEIAPLATSLMTESANRVDRELLLASILNKFETLYESPDAVGAREAWKARLETLGKGITVSFRGESWDGVAEGVDEHGCLLLRRQNGELLTFEAGEVSLRC
jgi:BirA family biotin operon repressor/biotin-[acetyl-CoA-carboxylase] ligase